MPGAQRLGFTFDNVLRAWDTGPFALLTLAVCVASCVWYLQAVWALSARGRRWNRMRTLSFVMGLVMIDLALQSPVATFSMGYFEAHMIQHLLLMVTAPPLLALGAPMTLALQTSNRTVKIRILRVLNSRAFRWWSHPVPTAAFYYFAMFAFFLTSGVDEAMRHMWAMDLVNIAFLLASLHFWWPIVGLDHIPHWPMSHGGKLVALLIGVPIESFLALALLTTTRPVASMYTVGSTHAGAGILWIGAEVSTFLALIPVFVQWLRSEGRRTARIDAELDATYVAAGTTITAFGPGPDRGPLDG